MLLYILQYAILEYNILTLKHFRRSYSDRLVVPKIHFFIGDVAVLPIKCDSSGILLERPDENFGVSMRNGIFFDIIEQFAAYSPALCVFGDIQPHISNAFGKSVSSVLPKDIIPITVPSSSHTRSVGRPDAKSAALSTALII